MFATVLLIGRLLPEEKHSGKVLCSEKQPPKHSNQYKLSQLGLFRHR